MSFVSSAYAPDIKVYPDDPTDLQLGHAADDELVCRLLSEPEERLQIRASWD